MGLFSSKKKVYVASTVYNMAGDEDERPNYLKSLVIQNILSNRKIGMSDTFQAGYLHGPGIDLRSFYNWAKRPGNYERVGIPSGSLNSGVNVDSSIIGSQIPVGSGNSAYVQLAEYGGADFSYWAEEYMLEVRPNEVNDNWIADYDEDLNKIIITFEDASTVSFTPVGFDYKARYIYAPYIITRSNDVGPIDYGSWINVTNFPSTSGWTTVSDTLTPRSMNLEKKTRTQVTYSDSTPPTDNTVTENSTLNYNDRDAQFMRREYQGSTVIGNSTYITAIHYVRAFEERRSKVSDTTTETTTETVGGVTITTTKTVTQESSQINKRYKTDEQEVIEEYLSSAQMFIYRIGSGNAVLDALVSDIVPNQGEFFPFIPVRIDGRFISGTFRPDTYTQVKKAYKKLTNAKFDDLVDKIADNKNVKDIDYAYVVLGVSLNVKDKSCKKYLYNFFNNLKNFQNGTSKAAYDNFIVKEAAYQARVQLYNQWKAAQNSSTFPRPPLYGTPAPTLLPSPTPPVNSLDIRNNGTEEQNFLFKLHWIYIEEVSGIGLGKAGAKKGDVWLENLPPDVYKRYFVDSNGNISGGGPFGLLAEDLEVPNTRIYWQRTENTYTYITLKGAVHHNYVYGGKYVSIDAKTALTDEEESGFVVPLHYPTIANMSLVDVTQMSTACTNLLLNSYQIVKVRWYQRGIFKIILVVVIAIVSVAFTGGAGLGLLGTNAFVGGSLGFTGLTAAIVGSVVNALAAVVLTSLIQTFAGKIFGEVFGAIVAAVLGIVIGGAFSSFAQGNGFVLNWSQLMRADNLMKLMDGASNAYVAYVQGSIMDMQNQSVQMMENYENRSKEISDLYAKNIGYGSNIIDPMSFMNSTNYYPESSSSFLTRTLMTGSDIAYLSHDMMNSFTELTLTLPNAYT